MYITPVQMLWTSFFFTLTHSKFEALSMPKQAKVKKTHIQAWKGFETSNIWIICFKSVHDNGSLDLGTCIDNLEIPCTVNLKSTVSKGATSWPKSLLKVLIPDI